ncbi:MAG: hypothetical protein LW625_06730 [Planctomycetaceae bacterium]|nr:hypothetical protein [Planctomycetaceae bacterium]
MHPANAQTIPRPVREPLRSPAAAPISAAAHAAITIHIQPLVGGNPPNDHGACRRQQHAVDDQVLFHGEIA